VIQLIVSVQASIGYNHLVLNIKDNQDIRQLKKVRSEGNCVSSGSPCLAMASRSESTCSTSSDSLIKMMDDLKKQFDNYLNSLDNVKTSDEIEKTEIQKIKKGLKMINDKQIDMFERLRQEEKQVRDVLNEEKKQSEIKEENERIAASKRKLNFAAAVKGKEEKRGKHSIIIKSTNPNETQEHLQSSLKAKVRPEKIGIAITNVKKI
jgi:hypothetical protein